MASFTPADPRAAGPRGCSRTSCRQPATASLSFRYASSQVWLLDLSERSDPSLYDLCTEHADALTVPRGWEHVDDRTEPPPPPEPPEPDPSAEGEAEPGTVGTSLGHRLHATAGAETATEVVRSRLPHPPDHRPSRPPNRYAALSADLPRLAAALAETTVERPPPSAPSSTPRPAAPDAAADAVATPRPSAPGTSPGPATSADAGVDDAAEEAGPPPEVDGQLALGVDLDTAGPAGSPDLAGSPDPNGTSGVEDDAAHGLADQPSAEPVGAVVVPIGAGARRREPPFKA